MGGGGVSRGGAGVLGYSIKKTEAGGKVMAVCSMTILDAPCNMECARTKQEISGCRVLKRGFREASRS